MPTIRQKVDHVLAAKQTRLHHCHWPGCNEQVPPAKFSCTRHWYMIPQGLRNKIWAAYRPGQENDLSPSAKYREVIREFLEWARERNS